ncbi:Zn-ribbon domain-containing OB-fold protein [Streptomyces sp. NPDC059578]|uniref:Zn-ribbon domain-containing OB-fold protein n=1 Tax=unclassified Streptomyces TaxID=2593676 RepID=UPI0036509F8A
MSQPGTDTTSDTHGETGLPYQRCRWCGTPSFRRLLCPVCSSSDLESERSTGEGVVVRSMVVHRYTRLARNESLVRFPEGFIFRCRVVGTEPHLVWVGARVRYAADPGTDPTSGEVVVELCDPARYADHF